MQQVAHEVLAEGVIAQNAIGSGDIYAITESSNPLSACGVITPASASSVAPMHAGFASSQPSVSPQVFMSSAGWGPGEGCEAFSPLLPWNWASWRNINPGHEKDDPATQRYPWNLYAYNYNTGAGKEAAPALYTRLVASTVPLSNKISQKACVELALRRAPDPLFFSADLYGCIPNNSYTIYYNIDLLNALATVLAMISHGASSRAVACELLTQANILQETQALGHHVGDPANVSPGFRALLDDYLALAHAEDHDKNATMASVTGSMPVGFAGRSPSPAPNLSALQPWVNLYVAGHR
jgi:hypothetical protein